MRSKGLDKFLQASIIPTPIVGLVKCQTIGGQSYTRTEILGPAMGTQIFTQLTVNQEIGANFGAKAHATLGRMSGCVFGVEITKGL